MLKSFPLRALVAVLLLAGLAGCSSKKTAIYEHENFDDSGTFSRNYPVTDKASCEAARRALLSQGYIITSNDAKMISGHKSFQQTGESHLEASLGVGVLGSVSMPIGSSDDSMVKVASETVSSPQFYDRFFALVEVFLPKEVKKAAHIPEKPKTDLGVPEVVPAKVEAAPKPAAPVEVPAAAEPASLQPPVESAPVLPVEVVPAPAPVEPPATPPATPSAPEKAAAPAVPAPEPAITPLPVVPEALPAQ